MDDLVRGWAAAAKVSGRHESWLRRHADQHHGVKTVCGTQSFWEFKRKDLEALRPDSVRPRPRPPSMPSVREVPNVLKSVVRLAKEHPFATFALGVIFGTATFGQKGDVTKALGMIEDIAKIQNRFATALSGKPDSRESTRVDTPKMSTSDDTETSASEDGQEQAGWCW